MKQHIQFEEEFNEKGNKTYGAKNKRIAQSVGISVAENLFLNNQDSIEQNAQKLRDQAVKMSCDKLYTYYKTKPQNFEELSNICQDAAETEWDNLYHAQFMECVD